MRFKAKVIDSYRWKTGEEGGLEGPCTFNFSKRRLYDRNEDDSAIYQKGINDSSLLFSHRSFYTIEKDYNKDERRVFKIVINENKKISGVLELNWWNRIKCNWIHHRYWVQKEKDFILKTTITLLLGATIATLSTRRGYADGFREGTRQAKAEQIDSAAGK